MMNYKNYLIGLILLISNYSSSAVAQNFIWAKNACATNNSTIYSNSMAVDNSGNVYTIGRVSGTCDFDPSANTFNLTGSLTTNDMYIQKLDSNGNLLWAKLIVGTFPYSASNLVKTDNSGNIYVTGSFGQTVDFDPGPAVHNITPQGYEIFILKLDSLGDFIWVKTIAGTSTGALKIDALVVDANNNLILGGPYTDIVDFDPNSGISNLSSLSIYSGYILKLTSTGNFVWVKSFNSNYSVRIIGMDVDATNNIYCSGTFSGTLDLDPDTATNNVSSALNTSNGYIVKLDSNGSHIFGESFGGTGNILFATLDLDNNNNVIIGGTFKNFTDFDPSNADYNLYGPNSFFDVYLLKLSNTGTFIWAKQIQGYNDVELNGVDIDTTGSIYATGFFKSPTDFDPSNSNYMGMSPSGLMDGYLLKLDSNGNYSNAYQLGEVGKDVVTRNSYIYSIGTFIDTIDFDPTTAVNNLITNSNGDLYCFKWSECYPSTNTINANGCSYTLNGQTYTANGSYTQVLTNAFGCDSIITINLTGSSTNTSLNATSCTGSFTYNGQTYTSSGTYVQAYNNVAGCDSNTTLNLMIGTSNYGTSTVQACGIYFLGGQFYLQSGIIQATLVNGSGCDSIVTINLTIYQDTLNQITVSSCGPYTFNGQTYLGSGSYYQYYSSTHGCDSTVKLNLTIFPLSPPTILTINSCSPYTLNGQTYAASGVYNQIFTNSQGCDSTVQLNLNIQTPNINIVQNGFTLISQAAPPSAYQWINCNPYSIINGANGPNYSVTTNGSYAVIVDLNGCTDTSACITYTNVGIKESELGKLAKIYPNPTDDILNIEFTQPTKNLAIQITTATGQVIYENTFKDFTKIEYQTNHLANGIYFIKLESEGLVSVQKIIKN